MAAKKKTTARKKRTARKTAKKTTRKKTASKKATGEAPAEPQAEPVATATDAPEPAAPPADAHEPPVATADPAVEQTDSTAETEAGTAKKRRKRTTRRKTSRKTGGGRSKRNGQAATEADPASEADAPTEPADTQTAEAAEASRGTFVAEPAADADRASAADKVVEKHNGGIVVRMPPAGGVPSFLASPPESDQVEVVETEDQPAAQAAEPAARDDAAEATETQAEPAAQAAETPSESKPEPEGRRKRRSRRRRRRKGSRSAGDASTEAATAEPTASAEQAPSAATTAEAESEPPGEPEPAPPAKAEQVEIRRLTPDAPKVSKEMIINVVPRDECRIAILENGRLEEIYLERAGSENYVGNIYKGVVTNVEPSIQAAFVDFGMGKNGFLHISDLHPKYFPGGGAETETIGRKIPRRSRPPIQRCLRRGDEVIVQITKEGIGTKGPTLTTYLSIPGRFLVMLPGMRQLGVSRKIEDDDLRRRLRQQLSELKLPEEYGFIARTAADGRTKRELQSDLNYLLRLWRAVEKRIKRVKAPAELYRESDLVIRTIRDVFTSDIQRIVVDDAEVARRAHEFLAIFSPRARDIVYVYDEPTPIFHKYGIEEELERLHSKHVPLSSGGSLVIEQTEALVAIDVNSGRFRTEGDAESTAYKINLEAADEIARQLRLRDLGGVIVCDFIDMNQQRHRRDVERRLAQNLKKHKERVKVLRMSRFGMIELTRQRQRASLMRSIYTECRACHGRGLVKTPESVALDVLRKLQLAATQEHIQQIEVHVHPEVAHLLVNRKRSLLHDLETRYRRTIHIVAEPGYGPDQVSMQCLDHRGRIVPAG